MMAGAPPDEPRPPSRSAGSLEQNAGTRTFDSAGPFDLPAFLDLCQDTASAQGDGDVIVDDGDGGAGDDGDDVGRPAGNIDWRLALVEADCEGLRDALNRSELQHQELLVRFHALQSSSEEGLRFDKDDNGKELGDLQERVRALERRNRKMEAAHNEAMEGLASDLVQCKMELASAREKNDIVNKRARNSELELCDVKLKLALSKSSEDDWRAQAEHLEQQRQKLQQRVTRSFGK